MKEILEEVQTALTLAKSMDHQAYIILLQKIELLLIKQIEVEWEKVEA